MSSRRRRRRHAHIDKIINYQFGKCYESLETRSVSSPKFWSRFRPESRGFGLSLGLETRRSRDQNIRLVSVVSRGFGISLSLQTRSKYPSRSCLEFSVSVSVSISNVSAPSQDQKSSLDFDLEDKNFGLEAKILVLMSDIRSGLILFH